MESIHTYVSFNPIRNQVAELQSNHDLLCYLRIIAVTVTIVADLDRQHANMGTIQRHHRSQHGFPNA